MEDPDDSLMPASFHSCARNFVICSCSILQWWLTINKNTPLCIIFSNAPHKCDFGCWAYKRACLHSNCLCLILKSCALNCCNTVPLKRNTSWSARFGVILRMRVTAHLFPIMFFFGNDCVNLHVCARGRVYLESCLSLKPVTFFSFIQNPYTFAFWYVYMSYVCDMTHWRDRVNTRLLRVRAFVLLYPSPPLLFLNALMRPSVATCLSSPSANPSLPLSLSLASFPLHLLSASSKILTYA